MDVNAGSRISVSEALVNDDHAHDLDGVARTAQIGLESLLAKHLEWSPMPKFLEDLHVEALPTQLRPVEAIGSAIARAVYREIAE
jgi:hypothetical protein